ncbi:hypothetical protein C1H46_032609 [Malus baccata]|uniref:Retrotransposon Copia-like N-terminal domain-containing protein n=1 Tax=Malus baccata TaxID=106549 RepID=A0A540L5U6_MALBA|nr:hypothetical protein C1H46_032609 [Malus baccata]
MAISSSSTACDLPNVSHVNSVKLDCNNYPVWLAQIVPVLKSHKLMSFVDGSSPCPPQFLPDDDDRIKTDDTVNPDFEDWVQKDQLALSLIDSSLSAYVLGCIAQQDRTARKTWLTLEERFASASQTHVSRLRRDLRRTTHVDGSIAEFLSRVNAIARELALAGSPVPETEIVDVIMENVDSYYKDEVIRSARSRHEPITYRNLEALLLAAEASYESCRKKTRAAAAGVIVTILLVGFCILEVKSGAA